MLTTKPLAVWSAMPAIVEIGSDEKEKYEFHELHKGWNAKVLTIQPIQIRLELGIRFVSFVFLNN